MYQCVLFVVKMQLLYVVFFIGRNKEGKFDNSVGVRSSIYILLVFEDFRRIYIILGVRCGKVRYKIYVDIFWM